MIDERRQCIGKNQSDTQQKGQKVCATPGKLNACEMLEISAAIQHPNSLPRLSNTERSALKGSFEFLFCASRLQGIDYGLRHDSIEAVRGLIHSR